MKSFDDSMREYKKHIARGTIPAAYRGLMEYVMGLKTHLANRHPEFHTSSNIYFGYIDQFLSKQVIST